MRLRTHQDRFELATILNVIQKRANREKPKLESTYTAEDLLHRAVAPQTLPLLVQCLLLIMSAFVADRPPALRRLAATLVCSRKLNTHPALPVYIDAFDPRHSRRFEIFVHVLFLTIFFFTVSDYFSNFFIHRFLFCVFIRFLDSL